MNTLAKQKRTPGRRVLLHKRKFLQVSGSPPPPHSFIRNKGWVPCSQQPVHFYLSKFYESGTRHPILVFKIHFNVSFPSTTRGLCPSSFTTKTSLDFSSLLCVQHGRSIPSPLISSSYKYLARNISREAPHHPIFLDSFVTYYPFRYKCLPHHHIQEFVCSSLKVKWSFSLIQNNRQNYSCLQFNYTF